METLLKRYPQLGPARVLDALACAYDNEQMVEEDLERERDLMTRLPPLIASLEQNALGSVQTRKGFVLEPLAIARKNEAKKLRKRRGFLHSLLAL